MRLLYINNDGGGFADYVEVAEGTTIASFFAKHLPSRSPDDFLIRVNRQPAPADQVLCEGDRISATPVKIEGAAKITGAASRPLPTPPPTPRKRPAVHRPSRRRNR